MRFRRDRGDPVDFEADTDGQGARPQMRQGAIEETAAVAQAVTLGIEGVERQDEDIRHHPGSFGRRRDAVTVEIERRFGKPRPEGERLIRRVHHRQRGHRPGGPPGGERGANVRFVMHRPAKSDAGTRRPGKTRAKMRDDVRRPAGDALGGQRPAQGDHALAERLTAARGGVVRTGGRGGGGCIRERIGRGLHAMLEGSVERLQI